MRRLTHPLSKISGYATGELEKKEPVLFCLHLFSPWQKLVNFFCTYIRPKESRSISYNSVYLIMARVENFAATAIFEQFMFTVK